MIIGIDLGTTNSLAAVWEPEGPRLIPNALGKMLTPSCVSLDEDGTVLIGQAAKERLHTHPQRSACVFKRSMGTDKVYHLGKATFRPEELSALVLRSLKEDAEAVLGQKVTEAIITVPAYFSDGQRKATADAGRLAGLDVKRLLNEPTAAALAYGFHRRNEETKFLVFDLGGGTFDVSILDLFEGVMEVRASAGDTKLGGEDFNQVILDWFFEKTGLPLALKEDPVFLQDLKARAEEVKRSLGEAPSTTLRAMFQGEEYALAYTEDLLEMISTPLLARIRPPLERALRDARLGHNQLDDVILAGGASRMPIVRRLVARMFRKEPVCSLNPEEVVAMGAAVQCGLLIRHAALEEVVMTDVTPYSLGVEICIKKGTKEFVDGHFSPVIERNTVIPASRAKIYYPLSDEQKTMELVVYQGEARLVQDNLHLGRLQVRLPKGTIEDKRVEVRFTYDASGLLEVEATQKLTGRKEKIVIQGNPGRLSEEEIAERLARLAQLKIHPRERLENRTLMARADRAYQVTKGETREAFGQEVLAFEEALNSQDDPIVRAARRRLKWVMDRILDEEVLDDETIQ